MYEELLVVGRKSYILSIISIIIFGFNAIFLFLSVKIYLSREFGFLLVVNSIFAFFLFFSDFEFVSTHAKKVAEKKYSIHIYFSTYMIIKIILLIIMSIIFYAIIKIQIDLRLISSDPLQIKILNILFISNVILSINHLYSGTFQGQMKIIKMELPNLIGTIARALFSFIVIILSLNFLYFIFAILLGQIITFIIYFFYGKDYYSFKFNFSCLKEYLSFGFITIIPKILFVFIMNLGPLIYLMYFEENTLGIYFILSQIFFFFALIKNSLLKVFLPSFSSDIQSNKIEHLKLSLKLYEKYMLIFSFCLIITIFLFGKYFIDFLNNFGNLNIGQNGLYFLYFSSLFSLSWALYSPYSTLLYVAKKYSMYILHTTIMLIFSLISWFFLIPKLGIIALDLGRWISFIFNLLIIRFYTIRKLNIGAIDKENKIILEILAILFIPVFIIIFLPYKFNILINFLLWIVLIFSFFITLKKFNIITKSDYNFIKNISYFKKKKIK